MAFRDFTFPQVLADLGLTARDAELFPDQPTAAVRPDFADAITEGAAVGVGVSTEKARSEFIVAPVLLELRRMSDRSFAVFSGVEWSPDAARGLNGFCDFILTRGGSQHVLSAPFVAIAEAKNDLIRNGLGQCIAGMVGAQTANRDAGRAVPQIFGIVTTGTTWKFLRLDGACVTLDVGEYYIDNLPRLMGVLRRVVEIV